MMKELDDLKKIFLADDVDDETRADNETKIREWEQELVANENLAGWLDHDVTKDIINNARKSYIDLGVMLATRRDITEATRQSLWARQDAMLWLITLAEKDAKGAIQAINDEIRKALNAT